MIFHQTPDTRLNIKCSLHQTDCTQWPEDHDVDVQCHELTSGCLFGQWELLTWVTVTNIPPSGAPHNQHKTGAHRWLFSIITWKLIFKVWPNIIFSFEYSLSECWDYANVFSRSHIGCLSTCQRQEITFLSFQTIVQFFIWFWLKIQVEYKSDELKIEEFNAYVL